MEKIVGFRLVDMREEEKKSEQLQRLEKKLVKLLTQKDYEIVECLNLQREIHQLENYMQSSSW